MNTRSNEYGYTSEYKLQTELIHNLINKIINKLTSDSV